MIRWAGVMLVGACLSATVVTAQEIKTSASPSVAVQYEDNLLRANTKLGGAGRGDFRVTPTLDLDLGRTIGHQSFFVRGTAGYDFHSRYKTFNRERILLDVGSDLRIGGFCRLGLNANVDYAQSDIADLGVKLGNTTQRRVYSVNVGCPRQAGIWLRGTASRTAVSNSATVRSAFDLRAFDVAPALVYSRPSIGEIIINGRYAQIVHPNRTSLINNLEDRTQVIEMGMQIERKIAARLGGTLGVAYAHTQTRSGLTRAYSGLTWQGRILFTPSPKLSVTGAAERRIQGETNVGAAFFVSTQTSLLVERSLGARTVLNGSIAREHRTFRGEQANFGLPLRGSETSSTFDAGVRYRLTQRINLSVSASHRRRDARNAFFDFQSTSVGAKAGITF